MSPYLSELIGTAILILLGNGVVANVLLSRTAGNQSGWIVITAGWGLAVALAVYSVGRIGGAHLNPAVTVGLASIGEFSWGLVPRYIACQLIGAILGACLVWVTYYQHWKFTEDASLKRSCFCTAPAIRNKGANVITEIVGTGMLVFGVLAIGANASEVGGESQMVDLASAFSSGFAPLLVGLLVFSIGLSLGGPTGYAINPARDLGPRIAHAFLPIPGKGDSDWNYSWIPVVGPLLGGVLGAVFFRVAGF
jgi:glycerol uptake facilitator protein